MSEVKVPRIRYHAECFNADGSLDWEETIENLVTVQGINELLTQFFKGAAYTAAWYVGLINTGGTLVDTDTALLHPGWSENVNYTATNRPTLSLGVVANKAVDNVLSKAEYVMTVNSVISGFFVISNNVKSGTNGVLYSEAAFAGGDKTVDATQVLRVTCTLTGA